MNVSMTPLIQLETMNFHVGDHYYIHLCLFKLPRKYQFAMTIDQ